jgi:RNA polymerase sporulation-specific sigma factor
MIIGEIKRYLRDNGTLRVSRSLKDIAYKAMKIKDASDNPSITNEQIALEMGLTEKEINEALDALIEPCSIYDTVYNDSGDSIVLLDQITDDENGEIKWVENISLAEAIKSLNTKEKDIINMRYYQGKTQIEVGSEIGISQAQVSRIEKSAIDRIKRQI